MFIWHTCPKHIKQSQDKKLEEETDSETKVEW